MLLRVGLTGGITTGKSTVLSILKELGCQGYDADHVVHELLGPETAVSEAIGNLFGPEVQLPGGGIDRQILANVVFNNARLLGELEAILHPEVIRILSERTRDLELRLEGNNEDSILVLDVALLFEKRPELYLHRVVVTSCSEQEQIRRLAFRDRFDREEAVKRIRNQMPSSEKERLADYVIDTSGSLDDTKEQTQRVHAELRDDLKSLKRGVQVRPKAYTAG
ncbi:dephospho-CoA kinase [Acidobacteriota bacterium]